MPSFNPISLVVLFQRTNKRGQHYNPDANEFDQTMEIKRDFDCTVCLHFIL